VDKRVVFAVAGSGKTTHIVNNLSNDKRSLIVTYTNANYDNLRQKIASEHNGCWPENITLMTYFPFLYRFCYKPFLSDKYRAKGLYYKKNPSKFARKDSLDFYMTRSRYIYSNRLALFIQENEIIEKVKKRIETYFDEFIIDEVQDIAGRDFTFLEAVMTADIDMLFVGDFYQHTYDTSRDGNFNQTLFDNRSAYEARFASKGLVVDNESLVNSWRCSKNVCDYVRNNLGIEISSNLPEADNTSIEYITDANQIMTILNDDRIIKLHYQNGTKAGTGHKNWGESKGEDHHKDVCVLLNKTSAKMRKSGKLGELAPSTRNKLYVAITRAKGNVYLIDE